METEMKAKRVKTLKDIQAMSTFTDEEAAALAADPEVQSNGITLETGLMRLKDIARKMR